MTLSIEINNSSEFRRLFEDYGRGNQFSYDGLNALYYWLEDRYGDTNYNIDVIGLCCDFTEYKTLEDIYLNYKYSYNRETSWDNVNEDDFKQWLHDNTIVIEINNYVSTDTDYIIANF